MFADAHIHLSDPEFREILPQILLEAKITGKMLIAVAVDAETSALNLKISEVGEFVKPFIGIHPWSSKTEDMDALSIGSLDQKRFAGIGEVGLDRKYARDDRGLRVYAQVR